MKKYYTAKLRAQGISPNIGLSGLIEAHGARDHDESTKCTALYWLGFMLSPLSHRPSNTRHGYDAHAHEQRARAWPERPPSLSSAFWREALGSHLQPAASSAALRLRLHPLEQLAPQLPPLR